MKKILLLSLTMALTFGFVFMSAGISPAAAENSKLLQFDNMVGAPQALTGSQNPIRGINGGGLPWTIGSSHGFLKENGRLVVIVHGLVFAAGPNTGKNTIPFFRAIVSCLDSSGNVVNITTDQFPATVGAASEGGGDVEIETTLSLPQTCIAPLIFVTSPGGAWFATIGK